MTWQKVFAVVPLFLFAPLPARADGPTLRLNNPGTVITAPTEVSVDLVMPGDPDQQGVGAMAVFEYDPTVVTLSNARAASPAVWTDFNVYSVPEDHQLRILMMRSPNHGQTTTSPLLYVTATPVGAAADLSVCTTLRLVGGWNQEHVSNLAIWRPSRNDWDSVYVPSSCGPLGPIYVPPVEESITIGDVDSTDGVTEGTQDGGTDIIPPECPLGLEAVARALRIYGGLLEAEPGDFDMLDRNVDEVIDWYDIITLAQTPCLPLPKGWYTLQGNRRHTGRAQFNIGAAYGWNAPLDLPFPGINPTNSATSGAGIQTSVIAVPDPLDSTGRPIVYAPVEGALENGSKVSRIYRIKDNGTGGAITAYYDFPTTVGFTILTAPLAIGNRVFVAGQWTVPGGFTPPITTVFALDYNGSSNPAQAFDVAWRRDLPGATTATPIYSPMVTNYSLFNEATGQTQDAVSTMGAILIPTIIPLSGEYYLFALDYSNGRHVWGVVYDDASAPSNIGNPVPNRVGADAPTATYGGLPVFRMGGLSSIPPSYVGTPALAIQTAYVAVGNGGAFGNGIQARRLSDGGKLNLPADWADMGNGIYTAPVIEDGRIYAGSTHTEVSCRNLTGANGSQPGSQVWLLKNNEEDFLFSWIVATPVAYRERDALIVADEYLRLFSPKETGHPYPPNPTFHVPDFDPNWSLPTAAISMSHANYASSLLAGVRDEGGNNNARLFVPEADRMGNGAVIHVRNGSDGSVAATSIGPLAGSVYSSMAAYAPPSSTSGRLYVLALSSQLSSPNRLYCIQ